MLLTSVFAAVYELLIGANLQSPEYRDGIFSSVGVASFLACLVICLLFYLALGRWKPLFHRTVHWVIALSATGVAGFGIAYAFTGSEIGMIDGYALQFASTNTFYTVVCFCILSLLLKRFSIFAKHTPF